MHPPYIITMTLACKGPTSIEENSIGPSRDYPSIPYSSFFSLLLLCSWPLLRLDVFSIVYHLYSSVILHEHGSYEELGKTVFTYSIMVLISAPLVL